MPNFKPAFVSVDNVLHKMGTGCPLIPNVQVKTENVEFLPQPPESHASCLCMVTLREA